MADGMVLYTFESQQRSASASALSGFLMNLSKQFSAETKVVTSDEMNKASCCRSKIEVANFHGWVDIPWCCRHQYQQGSRLTGSHTHEQKG